MMPLRSGCAIALVAALLATSLQGAALAQPTASACGPIQREPGGYGPFDYRTQRSSLEVVERFHFTPRVEALLGGQSATIGGDISYLMRTSPNHHRGLVAIVRWVDRVKTPQPRDLQYSVDCYFERAIRFAPDDVIVRVLFANFLGSRKQTQAATAQLEVARTLAGDSALTHYNIGLAYFDLGLYRDALTHAHRARALGLPRTELEDMLRKKGAWAEPPPATAAPAPSAAASAPG